MTQPVSGFHRQTSLRALLAPLRRTPLHPQWLLGSRNAMSRWVRVHATGTVLDVGCGDRWAEKNLLPDTTYYGLDSLHTGMAWYGAKPNVFGNALTLPFASESFDSVLLLDVLEHLPDAGVALSEAARVLKPKGRLLVSIPFLYPIHDAPHDYIRLTRHGLQKVIAQAGLNLQQLLETRSAVATAGLLLNLALSGGVLAAVQRRHPALLWAPLVLTIIPLVNLLAWLGDRLLPGWPAMTSGYQLVAIKH